MPTNAINDTGVKYLYDKLHGEIAPVAEAVSTDESTIEGNPINFTAKSAQNAVSTIIDLDPIQDLHGYDKPWVGGAGKNIFNPTQYEELDLTGSGAIRYGHSFTSGTYTIVNNANEAISYRTPTSDLSDRGTTVNISAGASATVTIDSSHLLWVFIFSWSASLAEKICVSSGTDTTFYPWKNECPISGRSEIGILGCGNNLLQNVDIVAGEYWSGANGNKGTSSHYFRTDKFAIEGDKTYTTTVGTPSNETGMLFWDANGNYIAPSIIMTSNIKTFTAPANASYCALDFGYYADVDAPYYQYAMLEEGSKSTYGNTDLTISLGQTVYGCHYSVENGVLVVDRAIEDMGDLTYTYDSTYNRFYTDSITDKEYGGDARTEHFVCSIYESIEDGRPIADVPDGSLYNGGNSKRIYIHDTRYSDASAYQTAVTGQKLVYELATPITINLTPNVISLLEGVNNISTTADGIKLTYRDGKVATLGDLTSAVDNLDSKIDESKILTDTVTGDKYKLVVTSGVLSIEQISN